MKNKFNLSDIVVWDGAITTFGVVRYLIKDINNVRLATKEEKIRYYQRPVK